MLSPLQCHWYPLTHYWGSCSIWAQKRVVLQTWVGLETLWPKREQKTDWLAWFRLKSTSTGMFLFYRLLIIHGLHCWVLSWWLTVAQFQRNPILAGCCCSSSVITSSSTLGCICVGKSNNSHVGCCLFVCCCAILSTLDCIYPGFHVSHILPNSVLLITIP